MKHKATGVNLSSKKVDLQQKLLIMGVWKVCETDLRN